MRESLNVYYDAFFIRFVNLGIGKLYALAVTHLDVVAVFILADALHHVGTGVVQGMDIRKGMRQKKIPRLRAH